MATLCVSRKLSERKIFLKKWQHPSWATTIAWLPHQAYSFPPITVLLVTQWLFGVFQFSMT